VVSLEIVGDTMGMSRNQTRTQGMIRCSSVSGDAGDLSASVRCNISRARSRLQTLQLQLPGYGRWCPELTISGAGNGPGLGKLSERVQIVEHGILQK